MKRDSFIFYVDWLNVIDELPQEIQLEIYQAITRYAIKGEVHSLSPMANIAFGFIRQALDRDMKKYQQAKITNQEKGRMGNLKRWHKELYQEVLSGKLSLEEAENIAQEQKKSSSDETNRSAKNSSLNVNANDDVNENNNDNVNENNNDNINDYVNININDNINDSLSFFSKKKQKKECVSPENFFQKENSFLEAPLNDSSEEEKKEKEKISAQKEKEAQKKEKPFDFRAAMLAEGFAPDLVDEWLKIRKAKKAINSEHAFELFLEQVQLTQQEKNIILKLIVQKQWKGFEASWLETLSHPSLNRKEPITIDQNGNILNPTYFNTTSTNTSPYVAGRQTAETLRANLQGW